MRLDDIPTICFLCLIAGLCASVNQVCIPETYFSPAAGGEYLWASPASRWSAACPGSPGTSLRPPCTPCTPAPDASSPRPCLCPGHGPRLPSPLPPTEGLSGAQLTAAAATGGGWQGDAWRQRRGEERRGIGGLLVIRSTSEDCVGHRRPVTAVCQKRKTGRKRGRGEFSKVLNGQSKQIDAQFGHLADTCVSVGG